MDKLEAKRLLSLPLEKLLAMADEVRRECAGGDIELCGIINAKSGACPEDCRFCAQSARHSADIMEYPLKGKDEIVGAAKKARENGAARFGIVTSGNRLTRDEVRGVADAIKEIGQNAGISPCASLGALDQGSFSVLKEAGLKRYHHNIETSERFYPDIVSTHCFSERINTIKTAKKMGFEVCSGGIIGMGEDWEDRIDMALLLKEMDVDAVPVNILVPVKGTRLESREIMSAVDVIRTIALFRIILRDKSLKIAAGRESALKDFGAMIYMAGANGMMIGGYLTTAGRPVREDLALVGEISRLWNEK